MDYIARESNAGAKQTKVLPERCETCNFEEYLYKKHSNLWIENSRRKHWSHDRIKKAQNGLLFFSITLKF